MSSKVSRELLSLAVCLFTVATVSCGKSDSRGAAAIYNLIDDMEGMGDGHLAWGQQPGFWSSAVDCSQSPSILPAPFFLDPSGWSYDTIPEEYQTPTMSGAISKHAAHLRTKPGQPLQGVWGANIGFDFAEQPDPDGGVVWPPAVCIEVDPADRKGTCPPDVGRLPTGATVNLTGFSGITFWAMASPNGRQAISVQINDPNTDPRGGRCYSVKPNQELNVSQCYNGFAKALMLTDTFTQYWIDFSEFQQNPSWGCRLGELDLAHVYEMNFGVDLPSCATDPYANCAGDAAAVSFDIWIDDLYFVTRPGTQLADAGKP